DQRCVPNALCEYGRTCNYCTTACAVATKQGGFCGDRTKNGPEECDFVDGTNQCDGLSGNALTTCQSTVGVANLNWTKQVCNGACTATCPPAYTPTRTRLRGEEEPSFAFAAGAAWHLNVDACRLLGAAKVDVQIGSGVTIWPAPLSVVVVTDLSGSMGTNDVECDADAALDSRIGCAKLALRGDGGLLDQLADVRENSGDVRVALVTFGESPAEHEPDGFRAVKDATQRQELKDVVQGYAADQGYTRTDQGLQEAVDLLNAEPSTGTKVIIFLTDGQTTGLPSGQTFATAVQPIADAFKAGSNHYIFTIAFAGAPSATVQTQMQSVASTPTAQYYFAGGNLEAFYNIITNVIAGVTITLFPPQSATGGVGPLVVTEEKAVTRIDRDRPALTLNSTCVNGQECLKERCNGQAAFSNFWIRVDFLPTPGSSAASQRVTIANPSAFVCSGPPWRP
ncbi:VWA domain-containing protein, partial [Candidatus Uhrbacteria bacterium]|nr:VWA domain-containing protein [Candidatus Uhrbacteria bacterium]